MDRLHKLLFLLSRTHLQQPSQHNCVHQKQKRIELNNKYTNIKMVFQQRAVNVLYSLPIYTHKIKVSVAFHSEIIAQ